MTRLIKHRSKFFPIIVSCCVCYGWIRSLRIPCKYTGKHPKARASVTWRYHASLSARPDSLNNCATFIVIFIMSHHRRPTRSQSSSWLANYVLGKKIRLPTNLTFPILRDANEERTV